jgi:hypothetical protein
VQGGGLGAAINGGDTHDDIARSFLGVFDEDVEVAVLVENAGVEQLVLGFAAAAALVLLDQIDVGKGGLRILIEILHVGMTGDIVQIEVVLLDVFAVIALAVG